MSNMNMIIPVVIRKITVKTISLVISFSKPCGNKGLTIVAPIKIVSPPPNKSATNTLISYLLP